MKLVARPAIRLMISLTIPLGACQPTAPPLAQPDTQSEQRGVSATPLRAPSQAAGTSASLALADTAGHPSGPPVIEMGSGRFIGPVPEQGQPSAPITTTGPDVTLDFVNVDVHDVARSVLGDLLHLTYVIDPAVKATVTLQTGQPIPRGRVLPTLADALQISGVALVEHSGVYQLVPIANAPHEVPLGGAANAGYITRAVTPQYVAADQLQRVLEPLLPAGTTVQADASRNALIITGTQANVTEILRDIGTFDVDYLRGMSFALLPLRFAQAREVAREVTTLLGNGRTAIGNMVSVSAIERLNAVLVTAMQPAYLTRVRDWVARLDHGSTGTEQQLYVYRVQNGRASDLAAVLRRALGIAGAATTPAAGNGTGRPGETTSDTGAPSDTSSGGGELGRAPSVLLGALQGSGGQTAPVAETSGLTPAQGPGQGQVAGQSGLAGSTSGLQVQASTVPTPGAEASQETATNATGIRITADETNNALVIAATPDEYAHIAAALQKLDITPLQVVIDATIAEVTLTNQLQYGLQYYIKAGDFRALLASPPSSNNLSGSNTTTTTTTSGAISPFQDLTYIPGLNLAIAGTSDSTVLLQALSQVTRVQVLSSPNLLVLNNQSARIQVGDQVPIATQSSVSTITANAPQVNSIEYRDTGVILNITPRVNASGLVLLDLSEEVSNASSTTTSTISSPTISQRRVRSSVAVSDGQTIVLGGLIQDSRTQDKNGVPILQDIPILGALFGTHGNQLTRTELIVLITPHVIRSGDDARAIADELRRAVPMTIPALSLRNGG